MRRKSQSLAPNQGPTGREAKIRKTKTPQRNEAALIDLLRLPAPQRFETELFAEEDENSVILTSAVCTDE